MKTPKPWLRGNRGWYVQIGKGQIAVGTIEEEA